ncbi:hypothetical protein PV797_08015 [Clostridiaceae bacterium M8S5]|nr:hypothetical protein PV797_08015 [Clostridiaceae bacterium M8S5]
MNRDLVSFDIGLNKKLVVTTDCSGSCGMLEFDDVKVSNEVVAYFTARVALMELMSTKAVPIGYSVLNLTSKSYEPIHLGVKRALRECNITDLKSISSSETNFIMRQTAIGVTFLGILDCFHKEDYKDDIAYGVFGKPLVGNEVLEQIDDVLSLEDFSKILKDDDILEIIPVGSKGIKTEFEGYFDKKLIDNKAIDIIKSAGPSTCIIVSYKYDSNKCLKERYKDLFCDLQIIK